MRKSKGREEVDAAVDSHMSLWETQAKWGSYWAGREAEQKARDESLRIALITNEINAGRISEIAAVYRPFLIQRGQDLWAQDRAYCPKHRIKALEHAANIGYVSAEETVEAAEEFAKHLSGKNEHAEEVNTP